MRVHPGVAAVPSGARTRCRALVGGFGVPAMRDLDFGRQFVSYAEALEWPDDVVVEDLSVAPHLVLHRLQELAPAKVVFVGSVERGTGGPGAIRRYRFVRSEPDPEGVHLGLTEGLAGVNELQHTLRVLDHWGMLPSETVVVEVEPADTSFGLGFSEEVGSAIERIVDVVRAELECLVEEGEGDDVPVAAGGQSVPRLGGDERRAGVVDLAGYADLHHRVADAVDSVRHSMLPEPPQFAGLSIAARARPFGTGLHTKGDWYDFSPVGDGWLGVAMGDVVEQGLEAAIAMSHLRSAVRAAAAARGPAPGKVVADVDRVVGETGLGRASTLVYLAVNAASGEFRVANAGHCRPLLVLDEGSAFFVDRGWSARLGVGSGRRETRPEAILELPVTGSLLLYTDGLLLDEGSAFFVDRGWSARLGAGSGRRETRPEAILELPVTGSLLLYTDGLLLDELHRDDARQGLSSAAASGPRELGRLCDHVINRCLGGRRRRDDASLVALRLGEAA